MADQQTDPHDEKVKTVPLPPDEADSPNRVIAQENQSSEVALGGGEWPSPQQPPTGPSPGAGSEGSPAGRVPNSGVPAGEGAEAGGFPSMRAALEADPVAGGSQSAPEGDEDDRR